MVMLCRRWCLGGGGGVVGRMRGGVVGSMRERASEYVCACMHACM